MLMVGEVILHHGSWGFWDQVSFKAPAAAGEEQPWAAQPGLVGRRWEGHVGTPWLHHEPDVLVTAQPAPSVLLVFVDFPDSSPEVDVSATHYKNAAPALHWERTLPVAKFTSDHSPPNTASV